MHVIVENTYMLDCYRVRFAIKVVMKIVILLWQPFLIALQKILKLSI